VNNFHLAFQQNPKRLPTFSKKTMAVSKKKIFVLDTSVLLHDHHSIMKFEENDVVIPITVLEELDKFKVGNEIKNFEARECIRFIDKISENYTLNDWIQLKNGKRGRLRIQMQTDHALPEDATKIFESKKNDHLILNVAIELKYQFPKTKVILVSKDINLRLKAKAMHIFAEDYKHGKVNDLMVSYSGITQLDGVDSTTVKKLYQSGVVTKPTAIGKEKVNNHFYILRNHQSSVLAYYNETENALLRVDKMYCCGIKPKNAEQTFALHEDLFQFGHIIELLTTGQLAARVDLCFADAGPPVADGVEVFECEAERVDLLVTAVAVG
jgi:PhoH-like ATPase